MKNLKFLSYLFVAVLCLGFTSCSDDDDDKNVMVYNSESYDIHDGHILNWGDYYSQDTYNLELCLYTQGVSFDEEEEWFTGTGEILRANMWCSSAELATGTYTYDPNESEDANTFDFLELSDENNEIAIITEGTITVAKSGNIYTIVVAGKTAAGETVTAFYKGTLNKFEMTMWA